MGRIASHSKTFLAFICIGLVALRISGAHLHYCFDGQEPPVAMHFDSESGLHHLEEHGGGPSHSDMDVSLSDDGLVKKFDGGLDLIKLFIAVASLLCLIRFAKPSFVSSHTFVPFDPRWASLRPPLRGPPR